jgi:cell division protein FtsA
VTGKGREITGSDVERVIEAAKAVSIPMDREILHVVPRDYVIDEQGGIKNPLDMIGVRLEVEVHMITGSVTAAQNLVKCVNRAGFEIQQVVFSSLAAAEAVVSQDDGILASSSSTSAGERRTYWCTGTVLPTTASFFPLADLR